MKLYLYYLVGEDLIEDLYQKGLIDINLSYHPLDEGRKVILYASTTNKKLAKEFERTRHMDAFIKKVVDDGDFDECYAEHDMFATGLRVSQLRYADHTYITAVLTGVEVYNIENMAEIIMDYLSPRMVRYDIFEDNLQKVLYRMGYVDTYNVLDPDYVFADERYYRRAGILLWKNELGGLGWMYKNIVDIGAILERGDRLDEESVVSIRGY